MLTPELAALATGHQTSRFAADIATFRSQISDAFAGRRVLVVGGAGSIGSAALRLLLRFAPAAVHVIDHNENALAELVRDLRSAGQLPPNVELHFMPLEYGGPVAHRFIVQAGPYDIVLHFAALKHVRSEKNLSSVLQMLSTNVLEQRRLLAWLRDGRPPQRYFAVSTDKAANPANFMGASKRLMEHLIFTNGVNPLDTTLCTSARFANVAFSAGSLLESWGERLRRRQPLAVPYRTRRFFVSLEESGEICLLAATCIPDGHLAVPHLSEEADARELLPIAEAYVAAAGFRPAFYEAEVAARESASSDIAAGRWPILITPRDTVGEKGTEVFVGRNETAIDVGFNALHAVRQTGTDSRTLNEVLDAITELVEDPRLSSSKETVADLIRRVVPEFDHTFVGASLDERM